MHPAHRRNRHRLKGTLHFIFFQAGDATTSNCSTPTAPKSLLICGINTWVALSSDSCCRPLQLFDFSGSLVPHGGINTLAQSGEMPVRVSTSVSPFGKVIAKQMVPRLVLPKISPEYFMCHFAVTCQKRSRQFEMILPSGSCFIFMPFRQLCLNTPFA